jgi:hypothetical protein
MKVKRYWKVGEEFICKPKKWRFLYSTTVADLVWYFLLCYVVWALLNIFAAEFISRGILDVQRYVGAIPDDWSCFTYNKSLHDEFSCSYAIKAGDGFNVSTSDYFVCYKLHNMTLDSTSEMTGALGISFSVFLFAVAALRIGIKFLGGLCSTRKESHPQGNPVFIYAFVLFIFGIIYYCAVLLIGMFQRNLPILADRKIVTELAFTAFAILLLPVFVAHLEYLTEETNIPWTSIELPEEDNKCLNQLR